LNIFDVIVDLLKTL